MKDEYYMRRCIDLARKGGAQVYTNPNVGALLVADGRIIGEGWHERFGGPHAEVKAVENVKKEDRHLIKKATLYVTLEPCNHEGKTPACTNLIINEGIKKVVIGTLDPNPLMSGNSVHLLEKKGIKIQSGILEKESKALIESFSVNILENRPYITLKWAQSSDLFISKKGEQTWLTNDFSKIESHKLRSINNAILIGTETALIDDPSLTNRLYSGASPLRIVLDRKKKIPKTSKLMSDDHPTLIISQERRSDLENKMKEQWILSFNNEFIPRLLKNLYEEKNIGRMIVEGGAFTISEFIKRNLWDEAWIFRTRKHVEDGIKAPNLEGRLIEQIELGSDELLKMKNAANP